MHCDSCGFENPDGMKFCGQCASALIPVCSNCQFENPRDFKFCGSCGTPLSLSTISPKTTTLTTTPPGQDTSTETNAPVSHHYAERRQLTVMFCDLVGSTALSEHVDPEDLRDIIGEYRNICHAVVKKYNGHIAQYLGDGVLTYFGYPIANEHDAIRAVQTGLELVRNMLLLSERLSIESNIKLSVRVGIHTGLVVIGGMDNDERQSLALGTTPNIAARLQDLATPNTVVISEATLRLVQPKFICTPLGFHPLKGLSYPVDLYQVDATSESHNQQYQLNTAKQTPMIGREQESALILDRLMQATNAEGQVVLLSGEAGIGKSRLAQFLRENVSQESSALFEFWGSPYHKNSFLHCVLTVLHRILALDKCESDEEKIKVLESPLKAFGIPLSETVPLLAELLSISLPEGAFPLLQYTPQQRKQKTLEALLGLVLGMASQQMVVIIVEDLHWIDPTTIELLGMLIDQAPTYSIFGLFTYRLEFTPPWALRSHLTQISINRLTRKQSGRMVKWVANNKELPGPIFNDIINKTDGTPFFVEELTKMVIESDSLRETPQRFELAAPLSTLAIPSTLQDSLMARLDRLGPGKEIAQLSATLGREFAHTVLRAVASGLYKNLDTRLAGLVCHELLYQRGIPPQASYTFRHALVHEVAYQSLLKKTRQKYHRKIASVLSTQFPEKIADNPEIMAHHCTEAGDYLNATQFWLRAGRMAMQRLASLDAIAHLLNGLKALDHIEDCQEKSELELPIQASLGLVYMLIKGYSAKEVEEAYARAYELCRKIDNTTNIFPILCGLWEFYLVRGNLGTIRELAIQIQDIAQNTQNDKYTLEANRAIGATEFWCGNVTEAYKYLQRGLDTKMPPPTNRDSNAIYGQDTEVAILGTIACVYWQLGQPDEAVKRINQSLALAIKLKHPFSVAYATYFEAIIHQLRGDREKTEKSAHRVIELCKKYDFSFWLDTSHMLLAWAQLTKTGNKRHIADYEQTLDNYCNAGNKLALTFFQTLLTRMHIQVKDFTSASNIIDEAISELEQHKEHFFKAEIYRLKAVILSEHYNASCNNNSADKNNTAINEIKSWFIKTIKFTQQQNTLSLELRTTTSYCKFLQEQKQYDKAHALLGNIVNSIKEGLAANDWLVADSLLTELMIQRQQQTQQPDNLK
ncbi:MAG: AAA family ATPase [Gammaproteobacteria bacterium]|nr:AAA family ATPase [Gammaproteobacteria bacterium]